MIQANHYAVASSCGSERIIVGKEIAKALKATLEQKGARVVMTRCMTEREARLRLNEMKVFLEQSTQKSPQSKMTTRVKAYNQKSRKLFDMTQLEVRNLDFEDETVAYFVKLHPLERLFEHPDYSKIEQSRMVFIDRNRNFSRISVKRLRTLLAMEHATWQLLGENEAMVTIQHKAFRVDVPIQLLEMVHIKEVRKTRARRNGA